MLPHVLLHFNVLADQNSSCPIHCAATPIPIYEHLRLLCLNFWVVIRLDNEEITPWIFSASQKHLAKELNRTWYVAFNSSMQPWYS